MEVDLKKIREKNGRRPLKKKETGRRPIFVVVEKQE
jgi:hypothetical protein